MAISCLACRHLHGVGFEAPAPDELERIEGFRTRHQAFPRGATIGDAASAPFLGTLYSGWAVEFAAGAPRAARLWLPGDLLGLSSLFGAPGGAIKVIAATDVTVCRFEPERLPDMLAAPPLAERLLRIALWQGAQLTAQIDALRRLPAAGRLAHFLLTTYRALARRRLAHGDRFRLPLQRQQMADLLGLTPLHLRRVTALLEADGLMLIMRDQVELLAPDRLRALADLGEDDDSLMPLL